MFWSTPKCPVEAEDKLWLEESMEWLLEEFGSDAFRDVTVVLPTDEFFPDEYSADEDDARALVDRVCGYMSVNPDLIEVEFFQNDANEFQRETWYLDEGSISTFFRNGQKYLEKTGDGSSLRQQDFSQQQGDKLWTQ